MAERPGQVIERAWAETAEAVAEQLGVKPGAGLAEAEARDRLARYGANRLRRARRRNALRILADQFKSPIVVLLAAAAVLAVQFIDWIEGGVIAAVIVINAALGFVTELRAVRSMESLYRLEQLTARVRRGGHIAQIPAQTLVPGDIVLVEAGDLITADLRLLESSKLQASESTLTGESVPVDKSVDVTPADTPLAERYCMLYKGTAATRGSVMALQSHGMTVAMTGDGVNDAPALKRADAGIAMGKKGSEAAKDAAELVLADDNFASIAAAVREGRTVYDNIKKVISWTLPTNAGEATTIIVALLFGMTLPVTPVQILWINLVTAITLGLALAFEPTEANTMQRPPRPRNESLLTGEVAWHIVLVSVLFLSGVFGMFAYAIDRGYSIELARTIVVNTLVVMEIFHLFFTRNIYGTSLTWNAVKGTKVVWLTVIAVTLAQFAITYLPPLQRIFVTESVPLLDGILIFGVGVALFAVDETEKQIRLRARAMRAA